MRFSSTVMPVRSADRSHALILALIITASLTSSRGQGKDTLLSVFYLFYPGARDNLLSVCTHVELLRLETKGT